MKNLLLWVSLLGWLPLLTQAQTTNFAPVGAKWTYNYEHSHPVTGDKAYGITTYDVEADTILLGKTARRIRVQTTDATGIVVADSSEYIAIDGQQVLYIREDTILQPLFDFGASTGDSVGFWYSKKLYPFVSCDSVDKKGHIVSTNMSNLNGVIRMNYEIDFNGYDATGGGSLQNENSYSTITGIDSHPFLLGFYCFTVIGNFGRNYHLRCYSDGSVNIDIRSTPMGIIIHEGIPTGSPCDTLIAKVTTGLKSGSLNQKKVVVYQMEGKVVVEQAEHQTSTYQLYNTAGQSLISGTLSGTQTVNTSDLPSGLYVLALSGDQYFKSKKIIIL